MEKKVDEKEDKVFEEAEALGREVELFKYDRLTKDRKAAEKAYRWALMQDDPGRPLTDFFVSLFLHLFSF